MASLTVNVPDTLVPRLVAAIKAKYPDLTGTNAAVGKAGVQRLLRDLLATVEATNATASAEAQAIAAGQAARTAALADGDTIT